MSFFMFNIPQSSKCRKHFLAVIHGKRKVAILHKIFNVYNIQNAFNAFFSLKK